MFSLWDEVPDTRVMDVLTVELSMRRLRGGSGETEHTLVKLFAGRVWERLCVDGQPVVCTPSSGCVLWLTAVN